MKKFIVLINSIILFTTFVEAKDYNYSVQMKESDGSVHDMGDIHIKLNENGQAVNGSPRLVTDESNPHVQLINKIQNYIKSNYQGFNVQVRIVGDGVVNLQGTVSSDQDKKNIENQVLKINGVKKVENNLKVNH